jgi:predicted dehydrogenase
MFGAGFWARYQLAGWAETGLTQPVAICDPNRAKAEVLAERYAIPHVYTDPADLLAQGGLDFVDIVTPPETHAAMVLAAAGRGLTLICQKPMGMTIDECELMVDACRKAGVRMFVNENFRWQAPLRAVKERLDSGAIGTPFRALIEFRNSFPVFDNQPFLKTLEQFIITDVGSHTLDCARFMFGEADSLYATTARIHTDIRGEDVATIMMQMNGVTVICELSFATRREYDRFPETYVQIEGDKGFLEVAPDYWIRETTALGTLSSRHVPPHYDWVDARYEVAHASVVPCQTHLARAIAGEIEGETTGLDNLKTMRLVYGAYESAATNTLLGKDRLQPAGW